MTGDVSPGISLAPSYSVCAAANLATERQRHSVRKVREKTWFSFNFAPAYDGRGDPRLQPKERRLRRAR